MIETAKPEVYACCDLANVRQFRLWAQTIVPPEVELTEDFHITVAYSRDNVNFNKLPGGYSIILRNNYFRRMEKLGEATVLCLADDEHEELTSIWQAFRNAGASWDYPTYKPHVTVTTNWTLPPEDVAKLVPYHGPLMFLPYEIKPLNK